MKKIFFLLLAALACGSLMGCSPGSVPFGGTGDAYHVDYNGRKDAYRNAKDTYRAGEQVKVIYDWRGIGTDTDYSFYLDGERLRYLYEEGQGFVISFTMPDHDVVLECRSESSMMYDPDGNPDAGPETLGTAYRNALDFESFRLSINTMMAQDNVYEAAAVSGGVVYSNYWSYSRWDDEAGDFVEEHQMVREISGDTALYEKLAALLAEYSVDQWDGFSGSDPDVLDGESFRFEAVLSDGRTVNASGTNSFPDGYRLFCSELAELVRYGILEEPVYQGEGFTLELPDSWAGEVHLDYLFPGTVGFSLPAGNSEVGLMELYTLDQEYSGAEQIAVLKTGSGTDEKTIYISVLFSDIEKETKNLKDSDLTEAQRKILEEAEEYFGSIREKLHADEGYVLE